jgi:hypothetical protein
LKVWIFSIVVHLFLLLALMWVRFVPEQKTVRPVVVISTYSYTPARSKPVAQSAAKQVVAEKTRQQTAIPAKPPVEVVATVAISPESNRKATSAAAAPQNTEQKSLPAAGALSLAERALASVSAKASEPMTERNQQREVVVRSSNPVDPDLIPDTYKSLKTFADGSSLINANGVCWRVPPPEAGKDAIWLFAGVSCSGDTKTRGEQINDILQNRRTYAED